MADIPYTISSHFLELTSTTRRSPPLSDLLPVSCHHRQDLPRSNPMTGKTRSALQDVVTREYTIHLHKHVHGHSFKKRAPKAVKAVITFAQKAMGVKDVRLDPKLNQELWKQGIKNVPHRVRVKLERKRNDEEDAKEKLYVYASHLPVASFKGLQTVIADVE